MKRLITFIQNEIVFFVATILAIFSCLFIHPDKSYINYLDYRVLFLLFCLMIVVAGFKEIGIFNNLTKLIISKVNYTRKIVYILVFLCFVLGMFITNDVALIVFVPFTIMIFEKLDKESFLIPTIVLQTLAANLGSMLTPIGNPQNLYLYNFYDMTIGKFLLTMAPVTSLALMLIIISIFFIPNEPVSIDIDNDVVSVDHFKLFIYIALFLLCLTTVLHWISYIILLPIVIFIIFLIDRKLFKQVDYMLLLTFCSFFVFIGNIGRIEWIKDMLSAALYGREFLIGVVLSQVTSNVPAAILLSNFTNNAKELLLGVNIGSLGTLIASMASLISYKFYANTKHSNTKSYLLFFTFLNVLYLCAYVLFFSIGL